MEVQSSDYEQTKDHEKSYDQGKPADQGESEQYIPYQGYWWSPWYLERVKLVQQIFEAEESDIILCSFPKSGTTWMKALTYAIMARDKNVTISSSVTDPPNSNLNPLFAQNPHQFIKFLESPHQNYDEKILCRNNKSRRLLATHIPYTLLPDSVAKSGCKIVYICRDPKDVFISLWYYLRKNGFRIEGSFEDWFEEFCRGQVNSGPIWDHVLEFWRAFEERPEKVLFLKYEELKSDTSFYVKKLAEFLEVPFSDEEIKNGQVEEIIKICSLDHLRNMETNKNGSFKVASLTVRYSSYFRKGEVGDWKNHLTPEMKEKLETIVQEKFDGSCLNILV